MPAPTFSNLTASQTGTDGTSCTTASISPTGGRLVLATIHAKRATTAQPPQPTLSGGGMTTWDLVEDCIVDGSGSDRANQWVFRSMQSSPGSGTLTFDFGAVTCSDFAWSVDQSDANVDTTGTNGAGAIGNTTFADDDGAGTSVSASITINSGNSAFASGGCQGNPPSWTNRTSFTTLGDSGQASCRTRTSYLAATDTAVSYTHASSRSGIVGVEVKAAASGVSGTASGDFGFTGTAAGVPETFGVAAGVLGFAGAAAGIPNVLGLAAASFGFTGTAAGIPKVLGVAAGAFGFTGTASGQSGAPPVTGAATGAFGFTGAAGGRPIVRGVAAASFGFTATANGQARTLGAAVAVFGFAAIGQGLPRVLGVAATNLGFTGTGQGLRKTFGTAIAAFGFTGSASGFAGAPPVTGSAAGAFGFTGTVLGTPRIVGSAVAAFGFTGAAGGRPIVRGVAVAAFGGTATAAGVRRVPGVAAGSFGFTGAIIIVIFNISVIGPKASRYSARPAASTNLSVATSARYTAKG